MHRLINRKNFAKIKQNFLEHKNIMVIMFIGILLASITIYVSFAYFQSTDTNPIIGGKVGDIADIDIRIYVQDKDEADEAIEGAYSKADETPATGYILNKTKSYCANGSILTQVGKKLKIDADQPDLCYVYYDVKTPDIKIVTTYNGTTGVPPVVGAIANLGCTNATAIYNNKYDRVEVTEISNKNARCNLVYTSKTEESKEYLNQKIIGLSGTTQGTGKVIYENTETDTNNLNISSSGKEEKTFYENLVNDENYPWIWDSTSLTWTSSNKEDNSTSQMIFNVQKNDSYKICYRQSSRSNEDYSIVYLNDNVILNLKGITSPVDFSCVNLGNLKISDKIKFIYQKDSSGQWGDDEVELYIEKGIIGSYRYEGKKPNNYILFNNELWRIIGVFNEVSHGQTGENLVKIIRDNPIGNFAWDKGSNYTWDNASLKSLLNGEYLNRKDGTGFDYCYEQYNKIIPNCDFRTIGIDENYRKMIKNVTWHLGRWSTNQITAEQFYEYERGRAGTLGSLKDTIEEKIGLMYPSDYGYSVLESSCERTTTLNDYDETCASQSWLYIGEEVTMTPDSDNSGYSFFILEEGMIDTSDRGNNETKSVRPVLYLNSSVYVVNGDGSMFNPYIIAI